MAFPRDVTCFLCGESANIVNESAPGYKEGQAYSICECNGCFASFASPLAVDDSIYGNIYNNIQNVPGYNRYFRYAYEVLNQKWALDYLSRQEESYWAVAGHLRKRRTVEKQLNILEVGCGMGYFTYALANDGFTVTGVDISSQAIAWALEQYGPYFTNKTLQDLRAEGNRYGAIIMNQLIEHIPDLNAFIAEAIALLSPEGELIITTPNKSAFPDAVWETDLPPVHLWWFGEESMRYLAQRYYCSIRFIDFEPYYDNFCQIKSPITPICNRQSILNAQGILLLSQPLPPVTPLRRLLERTGILELLRKIKIFIKGTERWRGTRGSVCAAVLRRTR
jgi:SAM-dependent methyltransferase